MTVTQQHRLRTVQVLVSQANSRACLTRCLTPSKRRRRGMFCANPNHSQLPNQLLEGRSVKGQIRSLDLTEIPQWCVNVFEVGMRPCKFCDRYWEKRTGVRIMEAESRDQIERARSALGFKDSDLVLGQYKVSMWEPYCTR